MTSWHPLRARSRPARPRHGLRLTQRSTCTTPSQPQWHHRAPRLVDPLRLSSLPRDKMLRRYLTTQYLEPPITVYPENAQYKNAVALFFCRMYCLRSTKMWARLLQWRLY